MSALIDIDGIRHYNEFGELHRLGGLCYNGATHIKWRSNKWTRSRK
jgi:hypothetical protein